MIFNLSTPKSFPLITHFMCVFALYICDISISFGQIFIKSKRFGDNNGNDVISCGVYIVHMNLWAHTTTTTTNTKKWIFMFACLSYWTYILFHTYTIQTNTKTQTQTHWNSEIPNNIWLSENNAQEITKWTE